MRLTDEGKRNHPELWLLAAQKEVEAAERAVRAKQRQAELMAQRRHLKPLDRKAMAKIERIMAVLNVG